MKIVCMYINNKKVNKKENKNVIKTFADGINVNLLDIKVYRVMLSIGYAVMLVLLPDTVMAAGSTNGGANLIMLMQRFSFWVGLGVAVWGVVEMQLNLPGWKGRIAKGLIGYGLTLILPLIFIELRNNLNLNAWVNEINSGN